MRPALVVRDVARASVARSLLRARTIAAECRPLRLGGTSCDETARAAWRKIVSLCVQSGAATALAHASSMSDLPRPVPAKIVARPRRSAQVSDIALEGARASRWVHGHVPQPGHRADDRLAGEEGFVFRAHAATVRSPAPAQLQDLRRGLVLEQPRALGVRLPAPLNLGLGRLVGCAWPGGVVRRAVDLDHRSAKATALSIPAVVAIKWGAAPVDCAAEDGVGGPNERLDGETPLVP